MIARILADAETEGARTEEQARDKAAKILQEAREQAAEAKRQADGETAKQADDIVRSARSAAELIRRNVLLEKKRELIEEALRRTIRNLTELPDKAYMELLGRLSERVARPGEGVLRLNARDLARPGAEALSRDLGDGRRIRLSPDPVSIEGGFLLEYGELEMNGSFSALLEEKREMLEDLLNRELFG